ncbi:unnamed protein product, partial [Discosporangium mesarthrocarpum]
MASVAGDEGASDRRKETSDLEDRDNLSPLMAAGWFSRLTFMWAGSFLELGSTRTLKEDDMHHIPTMYTSDYLHERLQHFWESEKDRVAKAGG